MIKIRIVCMDAMSNENPDFSSDSVDLTFNAYDEMAVMTMATEIGNFIEKGAIPIDIWSSCIKMIVMSGPHPTFDFYEKVMDELYEMPLSV